MAREAVLDINESLAFVILPNKFYRIFLHGQPIVPFSERFLCQTSFPRMVAAYPFVDSSHDVLSFVGLDAPEVGLSIAPSVQLSIQGRIPISLVLDPSGLVFTLWGLPFR